MNYLLSVQLGQELHFPPDGGLKKNKKSLCSWESAAVRRVSTFEREEAEKILIRQTVFLILCRLLKAQDVLTLFKVLCKDPQTDKKLYFKLITSI